MKNSPKKHENENFLLFFWRKFFVLPKKYFLIFLLLFPLLHNEFVSFCDLTKSFPFFVTAHCQGLERNLPKKMKAAKGCDGNKRLEIFFNTIYSNWNSHSKFFGEAWNFSKGSFNMWTTRVHKFLIFMSKMIMYIVIEVHIFPCKLWEFWVYDM